MVRKFLGNEETRWRSLCNEQKPAPLKCWFLYLIKVVTIKLKFKIVKTIATR
mgnify:CR=1 FL=1